MPLDKRSRRQRIILTRKNSGRSNEGSFEGIATGRAGPCFEPGRGHGHLQPMMPQGWQVKVFALALERQSSPAGGVSCCIRTPGRGVISDDDQEQILKAWAGSGPDRLSDPIAFRRYAPELKKAMDRTTPVPSVLHANPQRDRSSAALP